jgi:hypothetical protein
MIKQYLSVPTFLLDRTFITVWLLRLKHACSVAHLVHKGGPISQPSPQTQYPGGHLTLIDPRQTSQDPSRTTV